MVVGVEEVGMIGKPAEPKHDQHNDEHLGQLKIYKCTDFEDGFPGDEKSTKLDVVQLCETQKAIW